MTQISTPLSKSIRTGEGILVYASNIGLSLAAALPHGLSWTHAGLYLTVINGLHIVSRAGLKISAINNGLGIQGSVPDISKSVPVGSVFTEIAAVEGALAKLQAAPGTPAEAVTAGLSPTLSPVGGSSPAPVVVPPAPNQNPVAAT